MQFVFSSSKLLNFFLSARSALRDKGEIILQGLAGYAVLQAELVDFFFDGEGILPGITGEAEALRVHLGGLHHALDAEVVQGIEADEAGNGVQIAFFGRDELPRQAGVYLREGIQVIHHGGETNWMVFPLVYVAHLACLLEQMERAALLFGPRWGQAGFHFLSPVERTRHASCLSKVRIALGEPRFEQLFEAGRSHSMEQAIALAMETEDG